MEKREFIGAVQIPPGVFSRSYSLPEGKSANVAYHTPSQSITFLEDDSAQVWKRLFEAGGPDMGMFTGKIQRRNK